MSKMIRIHGISRRMLDRDDIKELGVSEKELRIIYRAFAEELTEALKNDERVVLDNLFSIVRKPIKRRVFSRKPEKGEDMSDDYTIKYFLALRTRVLTRLSEEAAKEIPYEEYVRRTGQQK